MLQLDNIKTITRSYAYGDIVMMSAILDELHNLGMNFTFRTDTNIVEWFKYAPYKVIPLEATYEQPQITLDNIVELEEDRLIALGQNKNRIEIMGDCVGIKVSKNSPMFYCTQQEFQLIHKISELYPKPYIGISPSSRWTCKTLGHDSWRYVIDYISSITTGSIFLFDSTDNIHKVKSPNTNNVHVLPHSWRMLTLYCGAMDLMVTHDSVWCHISASVNTPQLLLTSCTDGDLIARDYFKTIYPRPPINCYPCWYKFKDKRCGKHNIPYCMSQINLETLAVAIHTLSKGEDSEWESKLWTR